MRTYDAWFPRYALGNRLMFFCRAFSPAVGRGSSALSTFLDRRTQRVKVGPQNLRACTDTILALTVCTVQSIQNEWGCFPVKYTGVAHLIRIEHFNITMK